MDGAARSTTLCSGAVSTLVRSPVTISASQVSPGRRPGSGWSRRTTTLNSRAAAPVPVTGRALAPISTTLPGNRLPGIASSVTTAAWPSDHAQHVGFGDLHFGVDRTEIGDGHQRRAGLILDANDHHLAFAHAQAADNAVDRRGDGGLRQHVVGARLLRACLRDAPRGCVGGLPRAIDRGARPM